MKYQFKGKGYKTLTACYKDNESEVAVSLFVARNRLKKGWSLEDALLQPNKYKFNGKSYTTLASCYEDNKSRIVVSIVTARNRLKKGWSLRDALLKPKEKTFSSHYGEHVVEGRVYENLPSIAKEYNMSDVAVYKRYARGKRGDDLVPLTKRKTYVKPERLEKKTKYRFFVDGVGYKSEAAACKTFGVKHATYRNRINKGFSKKQALGIDAIQDGRKARGKKFSVDGTPRTVGELSKLFLVSQGTIRNRLERGATIRQAVGLDEMPKGSLVKTTEIVRRKKEKIELVVDGKTFTSYKKLADEYQLPAHVVRNRIIISGYTPEEAVKIKGKKKPVVVNGITYPSLTALAEAYGIFPEVLRQRVQYGGWSLEQAVGVATKHSKYAINYKGQIYQSLQELADKKKISTNTIKQRVKSGLPLEEAIDAAARRIKTLGRYNATILKRNKREANRPARLYFAKIVINGLHFFKVGITTGSVNERLRQNFKEFTVIQKIKGTLLECYELKEKIIKMFSAKKCRDVTSDVVGGYSDILNLDEKDVQIILKKLEKER